MTILHLYIPEEGIPLDNAHAFAYALRSNLGELQRSGSAALAELPGADRLELILPASLVLFTELKLPPVRGQKLRQMLPFAVEDKVLSEPDAIHVAAGSRDQDGITAVAIIDKAWLREVLEGLRKAGLRADRAMAETCLPELEPQAWTLVWNGQDGFVRTSQAFGLALDSVEESMTPLALARAVSEAKEAGKAPQRIIFRATDHARIPGFSNWSTALGVPVVPGKDWEWAPRYLSTAGTINFLQGEFSPTSGLRELVPELKPIWILAALIIALQAVATTFDWWRLSREQRSLTSEMDKTFRTAFPDAKVVVDAPLQMQRNLSELKRASGQAEQTDFLPLVAKAAALLSAPAKPQTLNYDNGQLKVDALFPDEQAVEELRGRVTSMGKQARIEATNRKDNGMSARLAIGAQP
jgi:general secretion pathway protein L